MADEAQTETAPLDMVTIDALRFEVAALSMEFANLLHSAKPSVHEAWAKVMSEVQGISKDSRNSQQKFNFRGIDTVMNVVGPVLRKHGVFVVPGAVEESSERYETKDKGTQMVNRTVLAHFTVYGPRGDSFVGSTYGEAADSGDKAMAKAHSVALRTFLLQALCIPTDEPDPDSESHDRAPSARPRPPYGAIPPEQPKVELPDFNAEGRDRLRKLCAEQEWDMQIVAGLFASQKDGQSIAKADNDTIDGFILLLKQGMVSVPGKPYKEPDAPAEG